MIQIFNPPFLWSQSELQIHHPLLLIVIMGVRTPRDSALQYNSLVQQPDFLSILMNALQEFHKLNEHQQKQHYKTKQTWCLLCRKHRIRSHSMAVVWKQQSWFGLIQCSWGSLLSFKDCREGKQSKPSVVCPLCICCCSWCPIHQTTAKRWQHETITTQFSCTYALFHVGGTMVIHSNYGFPISFTIFFHWSDESRSHFQWMWLVLVHDPCCIPWALPTLRCEKHLSADIS